MQSNPCSSFASRILVREVLLMTDEDTERDPQESESPEDQADGEPGDDENGPEHHLLSREEILATPDDEGDEDDEPLGGLTVGELMANMPKLPTFSLFRSPALDFMKMRDKLHGPIFKFPSIPEPLMKVPPFVERPEVGLQRGILEQQKAQKEVLLAVLAESQRSGRQTTWTLRFTAFSAIAAIVAIALTLFFGLRAQTTGHVTTPAPSPNISRSVAP